MPIDLIGCPPQDATIVIEAPEPSLGEAALELMLAPIQPLREQLTAITGFGLEVEVPDGRGLRRIVLPASGEASALGYLATGHPDGKRVVFLHGSPGLAEEWSPYLAAVPEDGYYIAVDRPGFGASGDSPITDLAAQARAIEPLIEAEGDVIIVGYSYGGPLALRLAADYPQQVSGVLLIGAAVDPGLEETHPLQELAELELFSELLPSELTNANAELLALRQQLAVLTKDLGLVTAPVTIIHGQEDTLVSVENAAYLADRLPDGIMQRVFLVEGADHFLPWTHADLLEYALACMLQDAAAQSGPSPSPSLP